MGVVVIIHGASMVLGGAMKGIGMQSLATWVVLIGFYLVAMPSSYIFAFVLNYGLTGLWMGSVCGSLVEFLIYYTVVTFYIDWVAVSEDIIERLKAAYSPRPNRTHTNTLDDPLLFDHSRSIDKIERKQLSFSPVLIH